MNRCLKLISTGLTVVSLSLFGTISAFAGEWKHNQAGWWYQESNSYPVNQWKQIEGSWYYFNQTGYMHVGWLQLGNAWYYLDTSGIMVTGSKNIDGINYSFTSDGSMQTTSTWKDIAGYYIANESFTNPDYAEDELSHGVTVDKYKDNIYIIKQWADTERRFHYGSSYAFEYIKGKSSYSAINCIVLSGELHYYDSELTFTYNGDGLITITNDSGNADQTTWNGSYSRNSEYDDFY